MKFTDTEKLVADIRNKLSPFWNIIAIIKDGNYSKEIIEKEANIAHVNQQIILNNLESILAESQYLNKQNSEMRIYDQPVSPDTDLFSIEEWNDSLDCGYITDNDGVGYWVKDGKKSHDEPFTSEQEDATHVAWYNK